MRLTYITEYLNTPEDGGLMRTWEIARYLTVRGHHVTTIVSAPHHMTGALPPNMGKRLIFWERIAGIRVARVWAYPGFRRGTFGRILYYLSFPPLALLAAFQSPRPDIVVGSIPPLFSAPVAWFVARMHGARFVLELRDGWLEFATARGLIPRRVAPVLFRLQRWLIHRADLVVAVTPGLAEIARNNGKDPGRVLLIMNGFEEDVFAAAAVDEQAQAELGALLGLSGKFFVVYAGTLGLARDTDIFVRAAVRLSSIPEVHFVFMGEGEKRMGMQAFCAAHGLTNCSFVSLQPRKRVPRLLAGAHVGVNSIARDQALESSLGNKLFEYMACGLPVVSAGDGDSAEFVRATGGGLVVPPEDDAAFADAIRFLWANPDERETMGARGREYVRARFARSRLLAPLAEALSTLVRKPQSFR
jgi:colanic acid biosynthesis glycosyl transferase WcaI